MNIKSRTTPSEIHVLEGLIRRLPPTHRLRRRLEEDLAYRRKGYVGEKAVDRFTASLLQGNFTILHDVYLKHKGSGFQIDTLIVGPHCIFVIEIKNYLGTVTFDFNLNQFTREHNGKITGFRNPIIQATTNKLLLTEWLTDRNVNDIPIYPLVAISDPGTIIKVIPEDQILSREVMHGEYMPQQVWKMDQEFNGKRHGHLHQKIGAIILGACEKYDFDYEKEYGINQRELLGGVHCSSCGRLGMVRTYKYWQCNYCQLSSRNAHIPGINDYLLLVKPWISNKACMQFLQIPSRHLTTRLLKTSNLIYDPVRREWNK